MEHQLPPPPPQKTPLINPPPVASRPLLYSYLKYLAAGTFLAVSFLILFLSLPLLKDQPPEEMHLAPVYIPDLIVPTSTPRPTSAPRATPTPKPHWKLLDTSTDDSQPIINYCQNCYEQITQWNDWLFYTDSQGNLPIVRGYNLATHQFQTIYDLSQDKDENTDAFKINTLQVIDNRLFISRGSYLAQGKMLWMDLPPTQPPRTLTYTHNGSVAHWENRYWLIGGEGDSCWGYITYSLLNLQTMQTTDIAKSKVGCSTGEEYIAIDNQDRFIMGGHLPSNPDLDDFQHGIFEYVFAVSLDEPTVKQGLIAKQDMPADITEIYYRASTDELILVGPQTYLFSLETQQLTTSPPISPLPTRSTPKLPSRDLETQIKALKLPPNYQFVLE